MAPDTYDLAILGGGPAGMSAALIAGRARLKTIIVNAETPRNQVTKASHGFLTRDGIHPLELLAEGKAQLKKYDSVDYVNDIAIHVSRDDTYLIQRASGPDIRSKRLIIATGYKDDLDSIGLPNLHEVYGKSVYPCPFCDGFEHSDQRVALFGGEGVEYFAPIIKVWSDDVHVFTNGRELSEEALAALERNGVEVHKEFIVALKSREGTLTAVQLADRDVERDCGFLFDDPGLPATNFAEELGVGQKETEWGMTMLDADDMGKTSVDGLYIVGDTKYGFRGLIGAASDGAMCVEGIVHEIAQERWQ